MTHYNYLIYENKIPVYIGDRSTKFKDPKLDIKYMGSGLLIGQTIKEKGIENFTKEILCECKTRIETHKNEETFIKYFKTHISQGGYNVNWFGGNVDGKPHSEETKEKMRKPKSKEHAQNISKAKKGTKTIYNEELDEEKHIKEEDIPYYLNNGYRLEGRPNTEETKEKISEALIGIKRSKETKEKIRKVRKGKTYEEIYGEERAKEIKENMKR